MVTTLDWQSIDIGVSIRILNQHALSPTSNRTQVSKSLPSCFWEVYGSNLFALGCVNDVSLKQLFSL
jgi:hypothetical protein